jgi:hypothetical protein
MTNLELSKANSKIYKLYGRCPAFLEIWEYLDKNTYLHYKDVTAEFSPQTTKMIEATQTTKTVLKWRENAQTLKHSDKHDPLSKKIYAHIKGCKPNQSITIALTVEEEQTILEL